MAVLDLSCPLALAACSWPVSQLLTSQPVISQLPQVIQGSITAVFLQKIWYVEPGNTTFFL